MQNKVPVRPPTRENVYDVIDGEIDSLDEIMSELQASDYLNQLTAEIRRARQFHDDNFPEAGVNTRNSLRKIAGLAVRGLQALGPIPCEFHVPASANITGTMEIPDISDRL